MATSAVVPSRQSKVVRLTSIAQLTPPPLRGPLVPPGVGVERLQREQARLRRRNVLVGLAGLALISFVAAITAGGVFIATHVVIDVLLVGYFAALVLRQRRISERHAKVTDIFSAPSAVYAARSGAAMPPERAALSAVHSAASRN